MAGDAQTAKYAGNVNAANKSVTHVVLMAETSLGNTHT